MAWGQEAKLVLVGGRHSPAAPLSHALLLDFAAKRCETLELPQQLPASWRQAAVMLGNFLLMVGGRTVHQAARTIAAFHLLDGRVVRGELPCGVHSTSVIKVRKYIYGTGIVKYLLVADLFEEPVSYTVFSKISIIYPPLGKNYWCV